MNDPNMTPIQVGALYVGQIVALVVGVNLIADGQPPGAKTYIGGGLLGLFVMLMSVSHDR